MKRRSALILILAVCLPALTSAREPQKPELDGISEGEVRRDSTGFFAGGQLFADFVYRFDDEDSFNEFQVRRAELAAGYAGLWGGAVINLETLRSAGAESFAGIDGNSLVTRLKHAFGYVQPQIGPGRLVVEAGLIADPWIRSLESDYGIRSVAPTASERGLFYDTSDLGALVGYDLWDGFTEIHVAFTNGEGRNEVEQNSGKNATFVGTLRPIALTLWGDEGRFGIRGTYRDGSLGAAHVKNHRIAAALTFAHPRLGAGAEFVRAIGYQSRSGRDAQAFAGWSWAYIWDHWVGAHARFEEINTDVDSNGATTRRIALGLLGDILNEANPEPFRLRWIATYSNISTGENAGPVPGANAADAHHIMLTLEANFGRDFLLDL